MPKAANEISLSNGLFIKLGPSGSWEKECLEKGILRFGYKETPLEAALSGDWETVRKFWLEARQDEGVAKRDVVQIRHFFTAGDDTLWITFSGGLLWWCFAKPEIKKHRDGDGTYRETADGWHNADVKGQKLYYSKLSGNLLKVQGFRGTICKVKALNYLV